MKVIFPLPNSIAGAIGAATIFTSQLFAPNPTNAIAPLTYETANDIPQVMFQEHSIIHGRVQKVIDGDTIRIRHYPLPEAIQKNNEYEGKLYDHTILIRLYGIDAPEIGKNGNPPMAYADDAKEYTISKIKNKMVSVKLLRKDQYSRVVGKVVTDDCYPIDSNSPMAGVGKGVGPSASSMAMSVCKPNYDHLDLSMGLAHNGYSTMYRGGGAEYDGGKNELDREVEFAQVRRKGMWTNGVENVQTPADYKKTLRENSK